MPVTQTCLLPYTLPGRHRYVFPGCKTMIQVRQNMSEGNGKCENVQM